MFTCFLAAIFGKKSESELYYGIICGTNKNNLVNLGQIHDELHPTLILNMENCKSLEVQDCKDNCPLDLLVEKA